MASLGITPSIGFDGVSASAEHIQRTLGTNRSGSSPMWTGVLRQPGTASPGIDNVDDDDALVSFRPRGDLSTPEQLQQHVDVLSLGFGSAFPHVPGPEDDGANQNAHRFVRSLRGGSSTVAPTSSEKTLMLTPRPILDEPPFTTADGGSSAVVGPQSSLLTHANLGTISTPPQKRGFPLRLVVESDEASMRASRMSVVPDAETTNLMGSHQTAKRFTDDIIHSANIVEGLLRSVKTQLLNGATRGWASSTSAASFRAESLRSAAAACPPQRPPAQMVVTSSKPQLDTLDPTASPGPLIEHAASVSLGDAASITPRNLSTTAVLRVVADSCTLNAETSDVTQQDVAASPVIEEEGAGKEFVPLGHELESIFALQHRRLMGLSGGLVPVAPPLDSGSQQTSSADTSGPLALAAGESTSPWSDCNLEDLMPSHRAIQESVAPSLSGASLSQHSRARLPAVSAQLEECMASLESIRRSAAEAQRCVMNEILEARESVENIRQRLSTLSRTHDQTVQRLIVTNSKVSTTKELLQQERLTLQTVLAKFATSQAPGAPQVDVLAPTSSNDSPGKEAGETPQLMSPNQVRRPQNEGGSSESSQPSCAFADDLDDDELIGAPPAAVDCGLAVSSGQVVLRSIWEEVASAPADSNASFTLDDSQHTITQQAGVLATFMLPHEIANEMLRNRKQLVLLSRLISRLPSALREHHDMLQTSFDNLWMREAAERMEATSIIKERAFESSRLMMNGEL